MMKSFSAFRYVVCAVLVIIDSTRCEPVAATDENDTRPSDKQHANRRSIGEYYGLQQYAPSYHSHYAPAGLATYHGHYAPAATHYHAHHGYAATAVPALQYAHAHSYAPAAALHYHHATGYAPAHYHGHSYAPAHYHGHYHHDHGTTVHGFKQPAASVVYQSVVHTYPTATTVVHKPVPVPVAHPVPVPVARPVAVEVPRPYPVPVNRPYPVPVIKPVPVPVAQPYPVTVYKPYPVPVYRPLPAQAATVARPTVRYATRVPVARVPYVRYPAHSHVYAPHYHRTASYPAASAYPATYPAASAYPAAYPAASAYPATYPAASAYPATYPSDSSASYLQQLTAVRAAAAGGDYDVNEAVAQQQQHTFQDEYSFLQQDQQDATDIHLQDDAHHHLHQHDHHHVIDQDSGNRYPSLTTAADDTTFKTSLGVPNTDYTGKKK